MTTPWGWRAHWGKEPCLGTTGKAHGYCHLRSDGSITRAITMALVMLGSVTGGVENMLCKRNQPPRW